jgi:NAD(P)H-hydrate epimerase
VERILALTEGKCAIVIGPGLWRTKATRQAFIEIIKRIQLPMVIDADAIRAISAAKHLLKDKIAILTPHEDEFRELTGEIPSTNLKERISLVSKYAKKLKTIILLKGHIDVISNGSKTVLNRTGSPYMTVGGMGDTLAGICGALLAKDIPPFLAAQAAAYINGKAGELAVKKYGEGVITTDLIKEIPNVIR